MRGLMADPSGKIIDLPIKTNFKEGLSVLEYFISTHGARKGLADTALRTADSGYLTRRLVDVSQDVIIQEKDCGTAEGIEASALKDGSQLVESLAERIAGRYALEDIISPQGELVVAAGEMISDEQAKKIEEAGIKKVKIRSVLTCRSRHGVCARCYGRNMALSKPIEIGEAVGIIAAQSIGEPGTQLTMRTFHVGGVAGEDITQGLPRVEELFEARKPKGQAVIAETGGIIEIKDLPTKREVRIIGPNGEERASYQIPFGLRLKVRDGDEIEAGDELTEGSVNPHELLKIKGLVGAQIYLLREVQKVYRLQGVDINDKHLEVIIRQMSRKVKVDNPGDTDLLPGNIVERFEFEDKNAFVEQNGGQPATAKPILLGITKVSLATNSFLSAASFQETTRVLTDAAIKAKEDPLLGLKENVIIGKLIPAGSGLKMYRNLRVEPKEKIAEEEEIGVDTLLVT
jgi:DNA-directed RNA polymerase subunit beta'